jgi:hypothetical protein
MCECAQPWAGRQKGPKRKIAQIAGDAKHLNGEESAFEKQAADKRKRRRKQRT